MVDANRTKSADASSYLLADGSAELKRLRLQARVWEPEAEVLFDRVGVKPGVGLRGSAVRRYGRSGPS